MMSEEIRKYLENKPKILEVLKKNQRSYVFTFEYLGNKYVYKEPIEKNGRKWQKFLTLFRGGESKREYEQMKKISSLGFKTTTAIFYTKDYVVYKYVEGRKPTYKDIPFIIKELEKIHSQGYLHGDSQFDNFLINPNGEIFVIDSKFRKNIYGGFGAAFEIQYLEESVGREIIYNKDTIYFKGAVLLRKYLTFYSKLKNIIRRR